MVLASAGRTTSNESLPPTDVSIVLFLAGICLALAIVDVLVMLAVKVALLANNWLNDRLCG